MSLSERHATRGGRAANRLAALRAAMARPATGLTWQPEPRSIGSVARGRQLLAGNYFFAGSLVTKRDASPWRIEVPDGDFLDALHGFEWLDDLAAVGDLAARKTAQAWVAEWIALYGRGKGAGWVPDLAGRRLIRWISHALFLLRALEAGAAADYYLSLSRQTIFLSRRWKAARPGLPRFEALTGLIYAGLSLNGMEGHLAPALAALEREAPQQIDGTGGIVTRNPEELLEIFTLLTWAAEALEDAGHAVGHQHRAAIVRIAPTLRTLRHADGALARFHGGGPGGEGRLDQALAASGISAPKDDGLSMGYARLSTGRTSVIVDAAPPPKGRVSTRAHASTLAFELTSGRRPVVVNCGAGESFGHDFRRAGRATPSHSTLELDGLSSSRLSSGRGLRGEEFETVPKNVPVELTRGIDGMVLEVGHDGYVRSHGLTHARRIELSPDGRGLGGEDMLLCLTDAEKRRFDKAMDKRKLMGIPFRIHFHLHPDVQAGLDMGGAAVSLTLKSGEVWVFRHDGKQGMALSASVYLERDRIKPRASKQIVLSGRAMQYATRIRWSFAKAQDTPLTTRDMFREEDPLTSDLT